MATILCMCVFVSVQQTSMLPDLNEHAMGYLWKREEFNPQL